MVAGAPPTTTPLPVLKALELYGLPTWKPKHETDGVTWFKGKVDYCETDAAKFTVAMPEVHAANVADMLDDDPKLEKGHSALAYRYDDVLQNRIQIGTYQTDGGVEVRRFIAQFKSPIFIVSQRDFASNLVLRYFLNEEEKKRFQIGHPGLDVSVTAGVHDPEAPHQDGFLRGTMHVFGWIAVDVPEGGCVYTQVAATELGGSLPLSLVNRIVGDQAGKLAKQREVFTEEERRVGRLLSPGPTIPAASSTKEAFDEEQSTSEAEEV